MKVVNLLIYEIINMEEMFFGCCSILYLNLKNFKTDNVICMKDMFSRCSNLEELDISNFNFNNVIISEKDF